MMVGLNEKYWQPCLFNKHSIISTYIVILDHGLIAWLDLVNSLILEKQGNLKTTLLLKHQIYLHLGCEKVAPNSLERINVQIISSIKKKQDSFYHNKLTDTSSQIGALLRTKLYKEYRNIPGVGYSYVDFLSCYTIH